MHSRMIITVCAAIFLVSTVSRAAVPLSITVQGKLTDAGGVPLPPGPKSFVFRIFNASVGGVEIWPGGSGEVQFLATDGAGLWSAMLGAVEPLSESIFADSVRWLEISVHDGISLTTLPRARLVTGPYAYRVATVDGASGGNITSKVSIGPGHTNSGIQSFVAGESNVATGDYAAIGGGASNNVSAQFSVIGGGALNTASAQYSVIGGGYSNDALELYSVVGGGSINTATGYLATISGGWQNNASDTCATVGGGNLNQATGAYATVPGGRANNAIGDYSFAAGYDASAAHAGTFVWADNSGGAFVSTGSNDFIIRAAGGVGIGTNSPEGPLHVLESSAGTMTANSASTGIFERNGTNYISILSPDANARGILFGEPSNNAAGAIIYNVSPVLDGFDFRTGGGVSRMTLDAAGNLTVDGCVDGNNTACASDRRFKKDIAPLDDALATVAKLRGVSYFWRRDEFPDRNFETGRQTGVIAQEVQEILPESVRERTDGYLAVEYNSLIPVLIEAIKEQQKQIDELKSRLDHQTP